MKKYISNNPAISDKEAKIIGTYIERKWGRQGVTAKQLLEEARRKDCVLHQFFEWNDSIAAEQYRISQARKLIISVHIESDDEDGIGMRNFLRVNIGSGPLYMERDQVGESQDLIEQIVLAAKKELERWKDRFERYCDFFEFNFEMKGTKHGISKENGRKAADNPRS